MDIIFQRILRRRDLRFLFAGALAPAHHVIIDANLADVSFILIGTAFGNDVIRKRTLRFLHDLLQMGFGIENGSAGKSLIDLRLENRL